MVSVDGSPDMGPRVHRDVIKEHQCAQRLVVVRIASQCHAASLLIVLVVDWLMAALIFNIGHRWVFFWIAVLLPTATVPSVYNCV